MGARSILTGEPVALNAKGAPDWPLLCERVLERDQTGRRTRPTNAVRAVLSTVPTGRRESDPSAMLGLVALVVVAELLAIVIGVALGFLVG